MKKILEVLKGKAQNPPPIWFMRQAGRYLPGYQELRKKYNFLQMIRVPELIAKVTLEPLELFDFDGAILFSDILVLLPPLGYEIIYEENIGFKIIKEKKEIELKMKDPEKDLNFVLKGIEEIQKSLPPSKTLIGFSGGPFTVFSYLLEGGTGKDFSKTKEFLYEEPELFFKNLKILTDYTKYYLQAQASYGAEVLQIFDTLAYNLPYWYFEKYYSFLLYDLMEEISKHIPIIYFGLYLTPYYKILKNLPFNCISIDSSSNFSSVREYFGENFPVQGNLDPYVLFSSSSSISREVKRVKEEANPNPHIFNLGHGVLQKTEPIKVQIAVQEVRKIL